MAVRNSETFFFDVYNSGVCVCKACETSMDESWNGEYISNLFSYCPACGKKILGFYESELDGEFLHGGKNESEVSNI